MDDRLDDFAALMRAVQGGSEEAARELLRLYAPLVTREVRKHLNARLRTKFDSVDFAQSVWLAFFTDSAKNHHFDDPKQLAAFLAAIARNKVSGEARRRLGTTKRNINREQRINDSQSPLAGELRAAEATPSQVVIAQEWWAQLLDGQPPHYQEIIRLRYLGFTFAEISERVGLDERTVRRALKKVLRDSAR